MPSGSVLVSHCVAAPEHSTKLPLLVFGVPEEDVVLPGLPLTC
jgi:hypothetical protein